MRRQVFWLLALVIASMVSFTARPALADPADDLAAVKKAFQSVSSVHIDFKRAQQSGSVDMVNPNKLHWTMSNGMQLIAIGQQSWIGGRWMQRPEAGTQAKTMMLAFHNLNLEGSDIRKKYKVTDAGMTMAAGAPAHKYHIVNSANGKTFDLLIGANSLPVEFIAADGEEWTFSQYNSVADIRPPM
jgi:hypothetical protein